MSARVDRIGDPRTRVPQRAAGGNPALVWIGAGVVALLQLLGACWIWWA
jgi:hypothetical protein